ncbi:TPA: hypothetical protein HA225_06185 [Candidatus Micrarchaeota archaeon]|nr:hypothetical protein [Candidatus Micrarchaeota archaeon]
MALELSLGISWQFGALAVISMLLFPHFRGRYAFVAAALAYSLVDIVPALFGIPGTVGLWTLTGALSWGLVGLLFTLQKPNGSPFTFAKLGIAGTLIFDAITGPILSPLVWGMPFWEALVGQIPFTAKHLMGIAAVSLILAPVLFPSVNRALSRKKWFVLKPSLSVS